MARSATFRRLVPLAVAVAVVTPATAAPSTIATVTDTSGIPGNVFVTDDSPSFGQYRRVATGYANATSVTSANQVRWQGTECKPDGNRCARAIVVAEDRVNPPRVVMPSIELVPVYLLYADGTPMAHKQVQMEQSLNFPCTVPPTSCSWSPGMNSTSVGPAEYGGGNALFTADDGKVTLVLVRERDKAYRITLTIVVALNGNASTGASYGPIGDVNFNAVTAGQRVAFNMDSPAQVAAKQAAADAAAAAVKCTGSGTTSTVQQVPACSSFTPLPSGQSVSSGNDPLPYRENTANSVVAVTGLAGRQQVTVTTTTPNYCSSPQVMTQHSWADASKTYIAFTSGVTGMCRLSVSASGLAAPVVLELPVHSWPVSVTVPPRVVGLAFQGNLQAGQTVKLGNVRFNYGGSGFDVGTVAPIWLDVQSPTVCSIAADLTLTAMGTGNCVVRASWPDFAFGSRVYQGGSTEVTMFTSQTKADASAANAQAKADAAAAAAKAKADAKLCAPAKQQKLRNTYAPLQRMLQEMANFGTLLSRAQYLSQFGNKDIQLPPSQFADILSAYPVLGSTRTVPLHAYIAVLNGAIGGTRIAYAKALVSARAAYQSASAGCRKVVGPPA